MMRDISKTAEADNTGPDVQPYQRYDVIPDISTRSSHHNEDKAGPDKNPWVPLPRISGDISLYPGIVIGSSHPQSPSSRLSRGLSLPATPKRPSVPPPGRHHLKVPLRVRVSVPASDYQRKARGKLGQNPAKRNRRQPKRLNDSVRRSSVKRQPADKIDISARTKISSGLALSAIAIILAI